MRPSRCTRSGCGPNRYTHTHTHTGHDRSTMFARRSRTYREASNGRSRNVSCSTAWSPFCSNELGIHCVGGIQRRQFAIGTYRSASNVRPLNVPLLIEPMRFLASDLRRASDRSVDGVRWLRRTYRATSVDSPANASCSIISISLSPRLLRNGQFAVVDSRIEHVQEGERRHPVKHADLNNLEPVVAHPPIGDPLVAAHWTIWRHTHRTFSAMPSKAPFSIAWISLSFT